MRTWPDVAPCWARPKFVVVPLPVSVEPVSRLCQVTAPPPVAMKNWPNVAELAPATINGLPRDPSPSKDGSTLTDMGVEAQAEPVHVSTSLAFVPSASVRGVAVVPLPVSGADDTTVGSAASQFDPFHLTTWPVAEPFKRTPPCFKSALFCVNPWKPISRRTAENI